ncbi:MAG: 2OG-Fe(II) oxygenase [Sinomicrobium sp.]|nr:2OG-Fe(II) oxygenase [Sinomicrobium sp.]
MMPLFSGFRQPRLFVFDMDNLQAKARQYATDYYNAEPFPHAVIDNFLPEDIADHIAEDFPKPDSHAWLDGTKRDTVHQPKKQGIGSAERLVHASPFIQHMLAMFNSYPVLAFLESLTGISHLLPDPYLHGGGLHQILPGGKLSIHADFNYEEHIQLYRRINLLLYLNRNWKDSYGGHLELWDKDMKQCVKRVAPIFNRCVIFNTDKYSYHGHPDPLAAPPGVTRKSVALYYYTKKPKEGENDPRLTDWQRRPGKDDT